MRAWVAPVLAALLAGCHAGAGNWTKPGANSAAVSSAYGDCEGMAEAAVSPEIGIDEDITASRGADWQRSRTGLVEADTMRQGTHDRASRIVEACMEGKGFIRPR